MSGRLNIERPAEVGAQECICRPAGRLAAAAARALEAFGVAGRAGNRGRAKQAADTTTAEGRRPAGQLRAQFLRAAIRAPIEASIEPMARPAPRIPPARLGQAEFG